MARINLRINPYFVCILSVVLDTLNLTHVTWVTFPRIVFRWKMFPSNKKVHHFLMVDNFFNFEFEYILVWFVRFVFICRRCFFWHVPVMSCSLRESSCRFLRVNSEMVLLPSVLCNHGAKKKMVNKLFIRCQHQ